MEPVAKAISKIIEAFRPIDELIGRNPILIYIVDAEYRVAWQNQYATDFFTVKRTLKAMEQPCYQAFRDRTSPCKGCVSCEEVARQGIHHSLLKAVDPQGKDIFLQMISIPVKDSDGKAVGMVKLGFDFSDKYHEQASEQEKENLFASIIDSTVDAVFFLDNNDTILSWNKGAEEIFGYSAEEMIGKSLIPLIPPELIELGELYYIRQELQRNGHLRRYETQRLRKDGSLIHVDVTQTLLHDENGREKGSSVIIKDITPRKELENELRRTIFELSKLNEYNDLLGRSIQLDEILRMILLSVTTGQGLRFDRAFIFMLDEKNAEFLGKMALGPSNVDEALPLWSSLQNQYLSLTEVLNVFRSEFESASQNLQKVIEAIRIPVSRDNHIFVKALKNQICFFKNGEEVGWSQSGQVKMENLAWDFGIESDHFVVAPLYAREKTVGVLVADNFISKKDIDRSEAERLLTYAKQAAFAIDNAILYQRLSGRIKELRNAYKKLEENSQRLLKAERLAAIGELSAKVAHEIRNPLVSIGGYARLLERKISDQPEMKKYASIIKEQISHLESILNNILKVARPSRAACRELDLNQVFRKVAYLMEDLLKERRVEIVYQLDCSEPVIWGDEKLIFQMYLNLLKNAVEAIGQGGKIIYRTRCQQKFVEVELEDTGAGIPGEDLPHIYEMFYTTKPGGTGLGLSVVQQIVTEHNGAIEISSKPAEGTIVKLVFPRYRQQKMQESCPEIRQPN